MVLIHKFRYRSSWHIRGFDGSIVIGNTRKGGSDSPTLPIKDIEPLAILSSNVSEINFAYPIQLRELVKYTSGGEFE